MAKVHPEITPELRAFIERQSVFFVATAPLAGDGHVNLSPKGLDALRVLSPDRVAWLDLTGSGSETSAHLRENGRVTVMLCAFDGPPMILRLYGRGDSVRPGHPEWESLRPLFPDLPGARQVVTVAVTRVQTSCGFGVPFLDLVGPRDTLLRSAMAKGEEGLARYRAEKNVASIDGLPTGFAD